MDEVESGSDRFSRPVRATLVLVGLLVAAGSLFGGYILMVMLGISFAHDSSPSPEFAAYSRALMIAPLLCLAIGIACIAATRRTWLVAIGALVLALIADLAGIYYLERAMTRAERVVTYAVNPIPAEPIAPTLPANVVGGFPQQSTTIVAKPAAGQPGIAVTSVSSAPVAVPAKPSKP